MSLHKRAHIRQALIDRVNAEVPLDDIKIIPLIPFKIAHEKKVMSITGFSKWCSTEDENRECKIIGSCTRIGSYRV